MENHPALLRLDRVHGTALGETPPKLDHGLSEANLAEALVALAAVGGAVILIVAGALATAAAVAAGAREGCHRSIVDDLVVEGVVGGAQRGVVYGEEAELGRYDGGRGRCHFVLLTGLASDGDGLPARCVSRCQTANQLLMCGGFRFWGERKREKRVCAGSLSDQFYNLKD